MIQLFFFLGTLSVFLNSLGMSPFSSKNVLITTTRCISKNEAQYVYTYDNTVKFSILKENHSLKQTETPNCLFHL